MVDLEELKPAEVAALYREVVATVREKETSAPVFLIAITPTRSRWAAWPEIKASNAALEAVCKAEKNVHFIPTEKAFLKIDGTPRTELFRNDQLHLNADGYQLWTKLIRAALDQKLESKPTGGGR